MIETFEPVRGFGVRCITKGSRHFVVLTVEEETKTFELQIPAKDKAGGVAMATAIGEAVTKYANHVGGGRVQ